MAHRLVVHCKVAHHDVYVGRPSEWGNPFVLTHESQREAVLDQYRQWLFTQRPDLVERAKVELRGKVLGCWCAPRSCHADVLAEIANPPAPNPLAAWFSGAKPPPPAPFVPPRWDTLDGLPPPSPAPPSPPLEARPARFCRYHPTVPATAAVIRPGGTVMLCRWCGEQVREGTLHIMDALGRYRGHVIPF